MIVIITSCRQDSMRMDSHRKQIGLPSRVEIFKVVWASSHRRSRSTLSDLIPTYVFVALISTEVVQLIADPQCWRVYYYSPQSSSLLLRFTAALVRANRYLASWRTDTARYEWGDEAQAQQLRSSVPLWPLIYVTLRTVGGTRAS